MLATLCAPKQLKLALFDLDGTLVDSVADLKAALDLMYRELGMDRAEEAQVRSWVGNGAEVLVRRALSYDIDPQACDEALFKVAYEHFKSSYEKTNGLFSQCYQGAIELLETLQSQGVNTAIITNKPIAYTLPLLQKLGLRADLVLGGDSLPEKKPSALPLLHALEHFSLQSDQAVMVGDSVNDVLAAQRAGISCVAVTYGYNHGVSISDTNPDLLVDSLTELR